MRPISISENSNRYMISYALNKLEAETKEGILEIPKCEGQYRRIKKRLYGAFHPWCRMSILNKLKNFEVCLGMNYPNLYAKYIALQKEAKGNYRQNMKNTKYKDRLEMSYSELDQMYKRAEERKERMEKEKGEKQEPKTKFSMSTSSKTAEEISGKGFSRHKSNRIF